MGEVLRVSGNLAEASAWFERSRMVFESYGDDLGSAFYYRGMGDVALASKDYQLAQDSFGKSTALARATKHSWMLVYALTGLGKSQLALQNMEPACRYFEEALDLSTRVRDKGVALAVLGGVTALLIRLGWTEEAIEVGTLVESHFASWRETKNQVSASLTSLKENTIAGKYEQARERGVSLDLWDTANQLVVKLQQQKNGAGATT